MEPNKKKKKEKLNRRESECFIPRTGRSVYKNAPTEPPTSEYGYETGKKRKFPFRENRLLCRIVS